MFTIAQHTITRKFYLVKVAHGFATQFWNDNQFGGWRTMIGSGTPYDSISQAQIAAQDVPDFTDIPAHTGEFDNATVFTAK